MYFSRDNFADTEYQTLLAQLPSDSENWVKNLWILCGKSKSLFANVCLYRFENKIYTKELQKKLQALLCSIKNLILDLRLGGVNIYRPLDNSFYFAQCVEICDSIASALQETGMLYLLSSTELIWDMCQKKI